MKNLENQNSSLTKEQKAARINNTIHALNRMNVLLSASSLHSKIKLLKLNEKRSKKAHP